jgi:hypothetical protein
MLIEALPDAYLVLTIEHGGVECSVKPHQGRAFVPAELGLALERARLARVIDPAPCRTRTAERHDGAGHDGRFAP